MGKMANKGDRGDKGHQGQAIRGSKGFSGEVGYSGARGRDGDKGDKGKSGRCLETHAWREWRRELSAWTMHWREFIQSGGVAPCSDISRDVAEVHDFLNDMTAWYEDLVTRRRVAYEASAQNLDRDIEQAKNRMERETRQQRARQEDQLAALEQQLREALGHGRYITTTARRRTAVPTTRRRL